MKETPLQTPLTADASVVRAPSTCSIFGFDRNIDPQEQEKDEELINRFSMRILFGEPEDMFSWNVAEFFQG